MGQNIRLINDILEQTKLQSIPGILLQLDFCKAFDTIEWSFIHKVIALLNSGDSIQRWISTFYSNSESAVLNNGFCTNYVKLSRGVRQGCCTGPKTSLRTEDVFYMILFYGAPFQHRQNSKRWQKKLHISQND